MKVYSIQYIAVYGAETWIINNINAYKLQTFETCGAGERKKKINKPNNTPDKN